MAAETELATYNAITLKLSELMVNPQPNYSIPGGATLDFGAYYKMLTEMQKAAWEAYLRALGPFTVTSVVR